MTHRVRQRGGVTLLELIVVVALLGLVAGVAGYTAVNRQQAAAPPSLLADSILAARRTALSTGRSVTRVIVTDSVVRVITALPDGRVVAEDSPIDPLTGRMRSDAQ